MRKFLWLTLLVLWIGFIWFNSSLSADVSGGASMYLTRAIKTFMDSLPVDYEFNVRSLKELEHVVRKLAHLGEFFVLGLVVCGALAAWRLKTKLGFGFVWWLGTAVAVTDEYIQLYVPGRSAQITDVMLDFAGVFIGWLLYNFGEWARR